MQFIADGPDIPDELLQAHEENRAVFFCGAGISYAAGLPSFKGLVDKIYEQLGTTRTEIEEQAYERNQYDLTLNLLEQRYPGKRIAVRTALAASLEPKLRRRHATCTHTALLQLACDRKGSLRLVTTNFDQIFERVSKKNKQTYESYAAPTLPIPKVSRWNGLVYLHGLLSPKPDESALNRLIVTSGDFGLAYLTERWAARFVSELFRNFIVCFVGYSVNDSVLRYMMDALAADRELGETTPRAYAFGSYEPNQQVTESNAWKSKGITPILYEIRQGKYSHSGLHQTLMIWAETYRDGILGRERIVTEHALARPSESTQQDNFVGRMLWALSDSSGRPAKRFAELNPVPPIEWLYAFSENRFGYQDLNRFGVTPDSQADYDLKYSFINRPAPYSNASWMALVGNGRDTKWDNTMFQIARWLVRHLNDPNLIFWLLENGIQLNGELFKLIETKLDDLSELEREGKFSELDEISSNSPNAIPNEKMRLVWRLLLTGRVKSSHQSEIDLYHWRRRLTHDGLSVSLRMEFRKLLTPMIKLRRPNRWHGDTTVLESADHLKQLFDWDLVLDSTHIQSTISKWTDKYWQEALPELLGDLEQLLHYALDFLRELGDADHKQDKSYSKLSSIVPHWQDTYCTGWTILIELLRDAWLIVRDNSPALATQIAERWFEFSYPTFKRLAFFAASKENCIDPDRWVEWLVCDQAWWLWSAETHREVCQLLKLQSGGLSSSQNKLETAILTGPPREMYKQDLEDERWQEIVDDAVWLRLAKLNESGLNLGNTAHNRLNALSSANPSWKLLPYEREEFLFWMSGTGFPDYEDNREIVFAPSTRHELIIWLRESASHQKQWLVEDAWRATCRTRFSDSLIALRELAEDKYWPTARWREALQVWSEEDQVQHSWQEVTQLVENMPESSLQELAPSVSWWLKSVSESIEIYGEKVLFDLCQRLLNLPLESSSGTIQEDGSNQNSLSEAINHSIGHVTEALLAQWFKQKPNDNDRLPAKFEGIFTQLCDTQLDMYRNGRRILASRLIALYRVDQHWTKQHLLPLFRWVDNQVEAQSLWEGFLWSPRIYRPLLIAFKPQLLETANHYSELGEFSRQYAAFLTYVALDKMNGYETEEFQSAFLALPQNGLEEVARTLSQALESAGTQSGDYWTNRIQPFWKNIWPKSNNLVSDSIAESLAVMSIAAGDKFNDALDNIYHWLRPIKYPDYVIDRLYENNLCKDYPESALRLLDAIIESQKWLPPKFDRCLTAISQARQDIEDDPRFKRLTEYVSNLD